MADGIDFTFDAPETPTLVLGKKKKKKKPAASAAAPVTAVDEAAGEPDADALLALSLGDKKKKKKKKKLELEPEPETVEDANDDEETPRSAAPSGAFSAFGALGDDDEDAGDDGDGGADDALNSKADVDDMPVATVAKKSSKKKKGKKKGDEATVEDEEDLDALLAELGDKPANGAADNDDDAQALPAKSGKGKKKKQGGKGGAPQKSADNDEDLDALLAELGGPGPAANGEGEVATSKSSKNKKKKKNAAAAAAAAKPAAEDDDLDALLAELDGPAAPAQTPAKKAGDDEAESRGDATADDGGAGDDGDELDAMMADLDGAAGGGSSAAAKKKKKKAKKAAAKAEAADEDGTAASSTTKKGGKKESAAVRRLREAQERKAAEEARLEKLREEEEAARREEERIEKEKAEARERAKVAKKEAEKARKARLKAEGKLLSKAEAAKKRKAEAFRQQALASGLVSVAAVPTSSGGGGSNDGAEGTGVGGGGGGGTGKVIYGRKKRNKPKKDDDATTPTATQAHTEAEAPVTDKAEGEAEAPPVPEPAPEEEVPDEWDAEPEPAEVTPDVETASKDAGVGVEPLAGQDHTARGDGEEAGENDADDGDNDAEDDDEDEDESESDSESDSDSEDSEDEDMTPAELAALKRQKDIRKARALEAAEAKASRSPDDLRSPIVCILGHVDTGKTKVLDRIRRTNVQDGEAGGITQQIGASYFPIEAVKKETSKLAEGKTMEYRVPSLLIIDTPGHESFTNLRTRGSSLCDIAILVVDIMHGLEAQTRESIELLKQRRCPFVVLLNKVDRMYDWNEQKGNNPVRDSLSKQKKHVVEEFTRRTKEIQVEFQEQGFNTALYWENEDVRRQISLIPTSAITGEGIPDLLMMILSLSQKLLVERLMFNPIVEATVLEVKVIEGLGTTIDIVLTGGTIRAGETIFVVGLDGVIQTSIRALLTPHPMKEMRVKGQYLHHKEIRAAQGIKISADGLDKAVAGTQLLVARNPNDADEVAYLRDEVMKDFQTILQNVDKSGEGVYVQASTLGSLEALLEFLRTSEIPVSGINIGPVHKKDVHRASAMLEKRKEFATILAFDVPVEKEARDLAEEVDVTIFTADIIYNLFDMFTEHMENHKKKRQEDIKDDVVFPCILKIKPDCVFNKKDPLILGVDVMEGILRVGCPLVVRNNDQWLDIGRVVSLEVNMKSVVTCSAGETVCVKIQSAKTSHITYGRHLTWTDQLVSKMSRKSIDILKSDFRNDLGKLEWMLVIKLKKMFAII